MMSAMAGSILLATPVGVDPKMEPNFWPNLRTWDGTMAAAECPVCFGRLADDGDPCTVFACRRHSCCPACTASILASEKPQCPICRASVCQPAELLCGTWWCSRPRALLPLLREADVERVVAALDGAEVEPASALVAELCVPPALLVRSLECWSCCAAAGELCWRLGLDVGTVVAALESWRSISDAAMLLSEVMLNIPLPIPSPQPWEAAGAARGATRAASRARRTPPLDEQPVARPSAPSPARMLPASARRYVVHEAEAAEVGAPAARASAATTASAEAEAEAASASAASSSAEAAEAVWTCCMEDAVSTLELWDSAEDAAALLRELGPPEHALISGLRRWCDDAAAARMAELLSRPETPRAADRAGAGARAGAAGGLAAQQIGRRTSWLGRALNRRTSATVAPDPSAHTVTTTPAAGSAAPPRSARSAPSPSPRPSPPRRDPCASRIGGAPAGAGAKSRLVFSLVSLLAPTATAVDTAPPTGPAAARVVVGADGSASPTPAPAPSEEPSEAACADRACFAALVRARSDAERTLVLAVTNAGFAPMWHNLRCSLQRLNLSQHTVVVGTDAAACAAARSRAVPCVVGDGGGSADGLFWRAAAAERLERSPTRHGTAEYARLMHLKARPCLEVLSLGHHVLFTDTDVVFLRDPLASLRAKHGAALDAGTLHVLIQSDYDESNERGCASHDECPRSSWCDLAAGRCEAEACGGFYLLRSAEPSVAFLEAMGRRMAWQREHVDPRLGEQPALNYALRRTPGLEYKLLPRKSYPNGATYFARRKCAKMPVIVHNNWLAGLDAKIERFESHGLWLLPPARAAGGGAEGDAVARAAAAAGEPPACLAMPIAGPPRT